MHGVFTQTCSFYKMAEVGQSTPPLDLTQYEEAYIVPDCITALKLDVSPICLVLVLLKAKHQSCVLNVRGCATVMDDNIAILTMLCYIMQVAENGTVGWHWYELIMHKV